MAKLHIARAAQTLDIALGSDLLRVIQAANHPIATSCGGRASCGLCRVKVVFGADALSPISEEELVHLGSVARVIGTRLACQAKVVADEVIGIDVPEVDDVAARKRLKAERIDRSGALSTPTRPNVVPGARIEWRPRKLEGGSGQGRKLPRAADPKTASSRPHRERFRGLARCMEKRGNAQRK